MADRLFQKGELIGGRFELTEPLGKGAFGAVWKAKDQAQEEKEVAVKILLDRYQRDKKMLGRFVQEAKILDKLDHPNICKPLAWSSDASDVFLAMEFIDGDTLDRKFQGNSRDNSPIPPEGVAWICDQLASAVTYAHEHDIIHRDLKPKNVMVNRRGQRPFVKVLDFGIAKMLVGSEIDPTTVGRVLGSVLYISPEQVLGQPLTQRADVFSLGTIMFELITLTRAWAKDEDGGPLPFHKVVPTGSINSHVAVLRRIAREGRPVASIVRKALPPQVDAVLQQAMAIKPTERFPSAQAFADALRTAITERDEGVDPEAPTLGPTLVDLGRATPAIAEARTEVEQPPPKAEPPSNGRPPGALAAPVRGDSDIEVGVDSRTMEAHAPAQPPQVNARSGNSALLIGVAMLVAAAAIAGYLLLQ